MSNRNRALVVLVALLVLAVILACSSTACQTDENLRLWLQGAATAQPSGGFGDNPDALMLILQGTVKVLETVGKVAAAPGGGSLREQAVVGRYWVQEQAFEDMERAVRDLFARVLGPGGFDPATDIEAITVNRWSHGYSYEYMRPWDAYWPDGTLPITGARKGWGRIAVANSDAGAYAYAHSAIDQAARAVRELLGEPAGDEMDAGTGG
jgi:hypothetical protein